MVLTRQTSFYDAWKLPHPIGYPGHVVSRNELQKHIVKNVYSMGSILDLEPIINVHIQDLTSRIGNYTLYQTEPDLWCSLKMHVFAVLGEMLYGYRFNAVPQLGGLETYLSAIEGLLPLAANGTLLASPRNPVGIFFEYCQSSSKFRHLTISATQGFGIDLRRMIPKRCQDLLLGVDMTPDIIAKFCGISAIVGGGSGCTPGYVHKELLAALFGGTDPTTLTLTSTLYHLMRNPDTYKRLTDEVDAAYAGRSLQTPISYNAACTLPYLKACIQEAMRLHPAVGYHLPRVVPPGGATIAGVYIPEGYHIGINPAVVQYDKDVFGADADMFNPDRWLNGNGNLERMEKVMLAFGAGDTACIGKSVATCLVYKLIPHLLRNFEIRLAGDKEPVKKTFWFTLLRDVDVVFKKRDAKPKACRE
ncbi:uncharacterized protein DSM5745_04600 [Aspergillus mulundensis]|uniref:Cytochrome P450 n=1 Tax=Aspergillus mulundensis TaxID=1810919 RepID=A0A3D8S412_9EURO|nr:hypothetical protein DSM5745_04600 [Aspergillus mulundensis]RDW81043.1 hypothetical protein DSM5745_04600 [Aspergillus mulundensis]